MSRDQDLSSLRVKTSHAYTARMCAMSRHVESERPDSLFIDPLGLKLAGAEAEKNPMGEWVMVPRTRYGDDLMQKGYAEGTRQLVMLGVGMDARAYRLEGMEELKVFEVDLPDLFEVKEKLLEGERLKVAERKVVATDFSDAGGQAEPRWVKDLKKAGFDPSKPSVWLLEGLVMYLSREDQEALMRHVGGLAAKGSRLFHDAISQRYERAGVVVAGAPFLGGSDRYGELWAEHGGFNEEEAAVRSIEQIRVDRKNRKLKVLGVDRIGMKKRMDREAVVLFVEVVK